jgi:hypothetical protein
MTDVTLAGLRVRRVSHAYKQGTGSGTSLTKVWVYDEATRADILAVVKQMGGVEVEVPVLLGDVPDGRYLVIPIDSL